MSKVPQHYIPNFLSQKEKNTLKRELKKSRKMYKKNKYYTRKKVPGYKNKKTSWEKRLRKKYSIPENKVKYKIFGEKNKMFCIKLKKIIKKGWVLIIHLVRDQIKRHFLGVMHGCIVLCLEDLLVKPTIPY